jgi:hypothetical protein
MLHRHPRKPLQQLATLGRQQQTMVKVRSRSAPTTAKSPSTGLAGHGIVLRSEWDVAGYLRSRNWSACSIPGWAVQPTSAPHRNATICHHGSGISRLSHRAPPVQGAPAESKRGGVANKPLRFGRMADQQSGGAMRRAAG